MHKVQRRRPLGRILEHTTAPAHNISKNGHLVVSPCEGLSTACARRLGDLADLGMAVFNHLALRRGGGETSNQAIAQSRSKSRG
jgi:hypothetical protein